MNQQSNWQQKASACPKCGGEQVEARVPWYGDAAAHLVSVNSTLGWHWSGLSAMVCHNCGFVEFYAQKPDELEPGGGGRKMSSDDFPLTNS